MGQPARIKLPTGCERVFPITTVSVTVTRISLTPPSSPSTERRWLRADLVPSDTFVPSQPEEIPYRWKIFPEWHEDAKCRSVTNPDDMFFGESDDQTKTTMTITKLREVKAFCRACPVFVLCLEHSLTTPERHGIWAGTSKRTRLRILALIESGETSIPEVIDDYLNGRERQYESIRR